MKLTKSLAELDAAADELLAKSNAAEDNSSEEDEVKPDEVSDSSATTESEDAEADTDTEDKEDKSEDEDIEKCNDTVKKSDETKEISEDEDTDDEVVEKSEDPTEDEDAIEKSEDAEDESAEEMEKSIRDDFESEESIKKGMESSEFNAAIVDVLSKALSDMQYDVQANSRSNAAASDVLAKSLQAVLTANQTLHSENERLTRRINKLEKSISTGFDKIMDSLDEIASQPAHMRKSMASISVQDRSFDHSLNGQQVTGGFESLSKSQVLTILNNELYAGNQNVQPSDIISYESGAPLRQDLQTLVANKCK